MAWGDANILRRTSAARPPRRRWQGLSTRQPACGRAVISPSPLPFPPSPLFPFSLNLPTFHYPRCSGCRSASSRPRRRSSARTTAARCRCVGRALFPHACPVGDIMISAGCRCKTVSCRCSGTQTSTATSRRRSRRRPRRCASSLHRGSGALAMERGGGGVI